MVALAYCNLYLRQTLQNSHTFTLCFGGGIIRLFPPDVGFQGMFTLAIYLERMSMQKGVRRPFLLHELSQSIIVKH